MTLNYAEKQLILLTKGHFKDIDTLSYEEKLIRIVAFKYKWPLGSTTPNDVYNFTIKVYMDLKNMGFIILSEEELLKNTLFGWTKTSITKKDILNSLLEEIRGVKIRNENYALDLGEPDFSLFQKVNKNEG